MNASTNSTSKADPPVTGSSTSSPGAKKETLALPEKSYDAPTTNLDMSNGSTTVKLDHLGPIVVNVDGTMSRIANWDAMADIEKKNTLRIISKRNKERLDVLKAKEAKEDGGSVS